MDPTVAQIIVGAERFSAVNTFEAEYKLKASCGVRLVTQCSQR